MTTPDPTPRPARRWRRPLLIGAAVLVGGVLAAGAGGWALLHSETGLRWLLPRVPGLTVDGVQGGLGSGRIRIERLRWQGAAGQADVDALELDGLQWRWRPAPGQWVGLSADGLAAGRVAWMPAADDAPAEPAAPLAAPDSLALPVSVDLPLRIGRLEIGTGPVVEDLSLQLALGADAGATHRLSALALRTAGVQLRDGRVQVGTAGAMPVDAALALAGDDSAPLPWQAALQLQGPLQRLALNGTLSGGPAAAGASDAVMNVDLDATLAPFAPWPLAGLTLQTRGLDLSALSPGLPLTQFSGHADLTGGGDTPLQISLALDNARPGRWDEQGLPVRRIEARVQGSLDNPGVLTIDALALQLADGVGPGGDAGRWQAQGRWDGHTLTLANTLTGVQPQRLDGRAVAMSLAGEIQLVARGLPSPDPAAAAPAGTPGVQIDTRLEGLHTDSGQPLRLQAEADLSAERFALDSLALDSGAAQARAQALVLREGRRWVLRSQGSLVSFDPTLWLPGPAGAAWRRGPHELNTEWSADLSLAAAALTQPLQAWLPLLAGDARWQVRPSRIAGLPLAADVAVSNVPSARVVSRFELAGNRLQLDGRTDLREVVDGDTGQWTLTLDAPALAALQPLDALDPAAADWAPKAGALTLRSTLEGRWPEVQTEGDMTLTGLRVNQLQVDQAQLQWQADKGLTAPLSATFNLADGRWAGQRLQGLQANLSGTLASHRLTMQAALPILPPPALARSLALTLDRGTRIALDVDGSWTPAAPAPAAARKPGRARGPAATGGAKTPPAAGRWTGRARGVEVASWNGQPLPALDSTAPWASLPALDAEVVVDAGSQLLQARVAPGFLDLAGGIRLRWDEVVYADAGERIAIKAEIENFRVSPLLARWQPDMGWSGDLEVGLLVDVQAGERFDADVVIERRRGDLSVLDGTDRRLALGLTDLRLAMNAHDGTWYFTQALAGPTLGEVGGAIRVQTSPAQRWPEPQAPLDGAIQARVANLGVWGTWVPPGWRLQGELATQAQFSGRFGAPEVTGRLTGSGLGARNLLLGVNVRDGEVAVRLDGERATVENFVLRGGEGELRLTGGATLGDTPAVQLAMTADKMQVLGRIDRRLVVSGDAQLRLDPTELVLDGKLRVDSGLFDVSRSDAPSLDDDVIVVRPGAPPVGPPTVAAAGGEPARRIAVQVGIDLGDRLRLRGRGLDARLAGQLRLTAPEGQLAVNGSVNTVDGTYAAYGQKMVIERGRVTFSGPPGNPRLDVLALRPKLDVEVGVEIIGSVNAPRVRLYSNPSMSDTDKLSWLVLGREPGAAGRADTALLQRAAVALLSGEGESTSDQVISKLGLDELSLRQSDDQQETIVTLGKQISDRWYVGYERSVSETVGTWQVIYRAAKRFTLRAESGVDQSLDAIWVWQIP